MAISVNAKLLCRQRAEYTRGTKQEENANRIHTVSLLLHYYLNHVFSLATAWWYIQIHTAGASIRSILCEHGAKSKCDSSILTPTHTHTHRTVSLVRYFYDRIVASVLDSHVRPGFITGRRVRGADLAADWWMAVRRSGHILHYRSHRAARWCSG